MQVTHLIENSKYLLSVFWCPLLIEVCKQAQSTQDLSCQSTQRCDCSFACAQYLSLFPQENTCALLTGAALRCLAKLYVIPLPSCRQSKQGSLPLEPCPSQLLSSQALLQCQKCGGRVLGSAGALRRSHLCGQTSNRSVPQPHCALSSGDAATQRLPPRPAALRGCSVPSCRCGRYANVRPAQLARSPWKASLFRKMRHSNRLTAPLENYWVSKRGEAARVWTSADSLRQDQSLTGFP